MVLLSVMNTRDLNLYGSFPNFVFYLLFKRWKFRAAFTGKTIKILDGNAYKDVIQQCYDFAHKSRKSTYNL